MIHGFDIVISPSSTDAIIDNNNQLTESFLDAKTRQFLAESKDETLGKLVANIADYDYDSYQASTISMNSSRLDRNSSTQPHNQSVASEMRALYESFGSDLRQGVAIANQPQYPGSPSGLPTDWEGDEGHTIVTGKQIGRAHV